MNNQVVTIFFGATAVFTVLVFFIIFFVIYYKQRQRKNILEKKALQTAFEQEKIISGMEIQEQTLHHVSQEIHDNIGQILSLARMQLNNSSISHKDSVKQVDDLLERAIIDIRTLSHTLNTYKSQNTGIVESTLMLFEQLTKTSQFETKITFDGVYPIKKDAHIIIYRMIQEVVNNIIKHSKASFVHLTICTNEEITSITIADNGIGLNHTNNSSGIGMRTMRERAKLANAKILFTDTNGSGTTVNISFL